MMMMMMNSANR